MRTVRRCAVTGVKRQIRLWPTTVKEATGRPSASMQPASMCWPRGGIPPGQGRKLSHQPDAEQLPVLGEQLGELGHVVVVVGLACAVAGVVPVPGGEVDPELQSGPAAGRRRLAHHISPAVFPGGIFDAVAGVGAGPQAEAVVVLAGQDEPPHPGAFRCAGPLVRVEMCRVKQGGAGGAVPPLPACKGVHPKVDEPIKLHLLPGQLPRAGGYRRRFAQAPAHAMLYHLISLASRCSSKLEPSPR